MVEQASWDLATRSTFEVRWLGPQPGAESDVGPQSGADGGSTERPSALGLRDLFARAHEIEALAISPAPALSAMYRLLYAITYRITGLDTLVDGDEEAWLDRRLTLLDRPFDLGGIDAYFAEFHGRFDLFDPQRPFMQDPRLADSEVCPKSAGVNKLALGRPAGNNSVWFGHHWDGDPQLLPTAEAFVNLLVWLYYGPSGRCSTRKHSDVAKADVSAGPLRSSLSYHPEGATLLETLLAGLTPPPPELARDDDLCPWELPGLPDPLAPPNTSNPYPGPRSRLTGGWQHALLLIPDATGDHVRDAYITWGRRTKQPSTNDAYLIHQISQQGNPYARPADSGRALWRDLDGLLQLNTNSAAAPRRPEVFDTVDDLGTFRARALGFEQDGKTKDVQFVSAVTPPLLFRIQDEDPRTARRIGDLRSFGELYGRRLELAAKKAWALVTDSKLGPCAWAEQAAAVYWPAAEEIFWSRMRDQEYADPWRPFLKAATAAFEQVTQTHIRDTRSARAVATAQLELYGGRRKDKVKSTSEPAT